MNALLMLGMITLSFLKLLHIFLLLGVGTQRTCGVWGVIALALFLAGCLLGLIIIHTIQALLMSSVIAFLFMQIFLLYFPIFANNIFLLFYKTLLNEYFLTILEHKKGRNFLVAWKYLEVLIVEWYWERWGLYL